jgi:hypothetical protein
LFVESRSEPSTRALLLGGLAALAVLFVATLNFLQTRRAFVLVAGGLLALGALGLGWARWTWLDANEYQLPSGPWTLLVALLPVVGFPAYLIAREIRRSG